MLLNQEQIKEIIPHRDPFILVDEVTAIEPGVSVEGKKYVTGEEEFFKGHFPGFPIMPGVLTVEAMAQLGAVCLLDAEQFRGKIAVLAGIKNARFKYQVRPGDTLEMKVELVKLRGSLGIAQGEAHVDGKLAASAEITFGIVDRPAE